MAEKIYLQLHDNVDLYHFYPSLKHIPIKLRPIIVPRWYKPKAVEWHNGPELFVMSPQYVNKAGEVPAGIILPTVENNKSCELFWAIMPAVLPVLAKKATIDYTTDLLLIVGAEALGDADYLCNLIKQWRNIILLGNNQLKLKWWKNYTRSQMGQVIQVRSRVDDIKPDCVCIFDRQFIMPDLPKAKLIIANHHLEVPASVRLINEMRISININNPEILTKLYGQYLPVEIVEVWLKFHASYHRRLSKWLEMLTQNSIKISLDAWEDNMIKLNIS